MTAYSQRQTIELIKSLRRELEDSFEDGLEDELLFIKLQNLYAAIDNLEWIPPAVIEGLEQAKRGEFVYSPNLDGGRSPCG